MRREPMTSTHALDRVIARSALRIDRLMSAKTRAKSFKSDVGLLVELVAHLSQSLAVIRQDHHHKDDHGDEDDDVGGHAIGFRSAADDDDGDE